MSFAETIIVKSLLLDKAFLASVASSVETSYLSSPAAADIYGVVLNYFNNYDDIPPQDIIINELEEEKQERAKDFLEEINSLDFDVARQYEYLIDKTDEWLKEKAMKQAILKSAIEGGVIGKEPGETDEQFLERWIEWVYRNQEKDKQLTEDDVPF